MFVVYSNFAVVFGFNLFPVPPNKAQFIGNVFIGKTAIRYMVFFLFYKCALATDAPNHLALVGAYTMLTENNPRNKILNL